MYCKFKITRYDEVKKNQSPRESSRLSPYFRFGCLSVRYVCHEVQRYISKVTYILFYLFYFTRFATHTNINTTKPLNNITYVTYRTPITGSRIHTNNIFTWLLASANCQQHVLTDKLARGRVEWHEFRRATLISFKC